MPDRSHPFLKFLVLIGWSGSRLFTAGHAGWGELARRFGAVKILGNGDHFRFQSAGIGAIWFRRTLHIVVAPNGLYLKPIFHGGSGLPALLIPWSELHFRGNPGGVWNRYLRFDVGKPTIERLYVHVRVATAMYAKPGDKTIETRQLGMIESFLAGKEVDQELTDFDGADHQAAADPLCSKP
jgi:hypothetical protein